ncbi:biopolymer transporter ExbB [Flavobacterium rivuli WB 3.3-2 = DSM 21788]|uniref:Biopolymer transporter ExbB n=1 Tax=Flavobacterium rivuli WB 3.3-2 = DSM 21788 TaxID=1121895 RepID=A0A0A2M835_9FLAO|nr:MotA/TolQ/ExbB proton channel family protein [Flavobacterium rivuli]KGO87776.1 biopolymer transporter ExbB [Flavobacterium rivuli WB 3.3-2 = DSM 21788]
MTNLILLLQDTIPAATTDSTATAAVATATDSVNYFSLLMKGGVMVVPILLLLFFTLYVIIERALYYKKVTKEDVRLVDEIRHQLSAGKVETAQITASKSGTAYGAILESGIGLVGRPLSEIEGMMEKTTNVEIGQMEEKLGWLGLVAGIAPILGFIGTISGVIKIFYTISITENISIGSISGGLYEKMISSGLGLIVGVIAYSGYHYFNMVIDSFSLKVQRVIIQFVNVITTGK